ncbi:hypothetical protein KAU33_02300 [Candidatus Dependentiae bacterium]|nr:hypothetical protein [Candidatus Dependentiae bacterium]
MDKGDVFIVVIIGIVLTWAGYGMIMSEDHCEMTLIEMVDIYSVSLHSDSRFILGTGESYFNYYYFKDWENGKKLDCVPTLDTKVIETDDETPKLKRYQIKEYRTFYSEEVEFSRITYYNELIVPTNTTQTTFRAEV